MQGDLGWFGLEWDEVVLQSRQDERHRAALDRLAAAGRLYRCDCSRSKIKAHGVRGADGGWVYPNTCRAQVVGGDWRSVTGVIRARLDDARLALADESGLDLSQTPATALGDPVVRRRDGAVAYNLAVVVDDADLGVTRVVRGRDIALSTATQVALQRLLGLPQPSYRHHLLFLEENRAKLAKLHGAVGARQLRARYSAAELCGVIAAAAGLSEHATATSPRELLSGFAWRKVRVADQILRLTGTDLVWVGAAASATGVERG